MFAIIGLIARISFILILLLSAHQLCLAQADKDTTVYFSKAELVEDLELVEKSLKLGHAGLYVHLTEAEIHAQFEALKSNLPDSATPFELYQNVLPITASIQCGHTNAGMPASYFKHKKFFPLGLKFIDARGYVFDNYSYDSTIVQATEILSINGNSMPEVVAKMWPLIECDANIETGKRKRLEEGFFLYYAAAFGHTDSFDITGVLFTTKDTINMRLPAVTIKRIRDIAEQTAGRNAPLQHRFYPEQRLAVLKINTFSDSKIRSQGQKFKKYLRRNFRIMRRKGVEYLVIDLRSNGGGDDFNSNLLLSYLLDEEFQCFKYVTLAGNRQNEFIEFTNLKDTDIDFKAISKLVEDSTYVYVDHPATKVQEPRKRVFGGKVLVLTGGGSASASGIFSSLAHYHKRAEFAGQQCATSYYSVNGYQFAVLILPNTGVLVRIPLMQGHMKVWGYPEDGRGVMPDYTFEPTLEDLIKGRDLEMEFVLEWIKQKESE